MKVKTDAGSFLKVLGKIGRSSSSNEKKILDSDNVLMVIRQPLRKHEGSERVASKLLGELSGPVFSSDMEEA